MTHNELPVVHPGQGFDDTRQQGLTRLRNAAIAGAVAYTIGVVTLDVFFIVLANTNDDAGLVTLAGIFWKVWGFLILAGIGSYVALALWMQRCANLLRQDGHEPPATWKIWASWLIPIYSLWGPRNVMRDLTTRAPWLQGRPLQMWWGGWIGSAVLGRVSTTTSSIDTLAVVSVADMVVFGISFGALMVLILRISASLMAPPPAHVPATGPRGNSLLDVAQEIDDMHADSRPKYGRWAD